ncbi:MAG TPA: hypothetical protein VN860_06600 [Candidatus Acidoferrales bacterium]|nr:hypothetical protein [Candidatus Acidoferrales bacterium]
MRLSYPRIMIVGLALALVTAGEPPPASGSAPKGACELVSAAAVSAAVGEEVQVISTARSPKSLCAFANFPKDAHATTAQWQPHFRGVTVALFNAATMSDPKVGSIIAKVGCRTVLAQCQKALTDRSPEELYNAQPRGAYKCAKSYARCFVSTDSVVWAMQTGNVVAIMVIKGSDAGGTGGAVPSPVMALSIYQSFAAGL